MELVQPILRVFRNGLNAIARPTLNLIVGTPGQGVTIKENESLNAVDVTIDSAADRVFTDIGPTGQPLAIADSVTGNLVKGVAFCFAVGENGERIING